MFDSITFFLNNNSENYVNKSTKEVRRRFDIAVLSVENAVTDFDLRILNLSLRFLQTRGRMSVKKFATSLRRNDIIAIYLPGCKKKGRGCAKDAEKNDYCTTIKGDSRDRSPSVDGH